MNNLDKVWVYNGPNTVFAPTAGNDECDDKACGQKK